MNALRRLFDVRRICNNARMPATEVALPQIASPDVRTRLPLYVIILFIASSIVFFSGLGQRRLSVDEAQYALIVENIRASGNWLDISPYPPEHYLHKPPLYMWLTTLTYDMIARTGGNIETRYRVWSAAFGVGCVVLTCVLGACLFASPEIGLIAAAILLANSKFVNQHGVRQGVFDPALAFFTLVAVLLFWMRVQGRLKWSAWIGIGAAAGFMCLLKPIAGVPVIGLLAIAALVMGKPRASRLGGVLLSLAVMIAIAGPWYLLMVARHGRLLIDEMFINNLVLRAAEGEMGNGEPPWFYVTELCRSSLLFVLSLPAMGYVLVRSFRPRLGDRVVAVLSIGWLLIFSVSQSKSLHYLFPVFPLIAIAIAAMFAALIPRNRNSFAAVAVLAIGAILWMAAMGTTIADIVSDNARKYAPWEMYQTLSPAIVRGDAAGLLVGFPGKQAAWRSDAHLDATDCFYIQQMRGMTKVPDVSSLAAHRPTLAIFANRNVSRRSLDALDDAGRTDRRFAYVSDALTVAAIDVDALLRPKLLTAPVDFSGTCTVSLRRTFPGDAWIDFTFHLDAPPAPQKIRARIELAGRQVDEFYFLNAGEETHYTTHLRKEDWHGDGANDDLTLKLTPSKSAHPAGVRQPPLHGELIDVRMKYEVSVSGRE